MKIPVNNYSMVWALKEVVDSMGLQHDRDYTWRYTPAVTDWLSSPLTPANVEFVFQDKQWETYFELKWSNLGDST